MLRIGDSFSIIIIPLLFLFIFLIFFSPVILSTHVLAPDDGVDYYLGVFGPPPTLWTDLMYMGWPLAADASAMTWHPLKLLGQGGFASFDAFIVSLFTLAAVSAGTLGYVLTGSRIAAVVTGLSYGMSGALIGHLTHPDIVGTAAAFPLVFAAIERSRDRFRPGWTAVGALSLGVAILGLHPNVLFYFSLFSVVYVLVRCSRAPDGLFRGVLRGALIGALGIAVGALQLLPTVDLATGMARSVSNYEEFVSYNLEPILAVLPLFPYLAGGPAAAWGTPYFGLWNPVATACYVGMVPFLLALLGVAFRRAGDSALLWLFTAGISFLFALGDLTPLARVAFEIPILNWGRGPARILPLFNLAVAVLAGLGLARLLRQCLPWRRVLFWLGVGVSVVTLMAVGLVIWSPIYEALAEQRENISGYTTSPLHNPATLVPLVILGLGVAAVLLVAFGRRRRLAASVLIGALLVDLSSFGLFFQWNTESPSRVVFTVPDHMERLGVELRASKQRYVGLGGKKTRVTGAPTRSLLWGLPNAGGNSSFSRRQAAPIALYDPHADNPGPVFGAVRALVLPGATDATARRWRGAQLELEDLTPIDASERLNALLVHDATSVPRRLRFAPPGVRGSRIAAEVGAGADRPFEGIVTVTATPRNGDTVSVTQPVSLEPEESALLLFPFTDPEAQRRITDIEIAAEGGDRGDLTLRVLAVDDPNNERVTLAGLDHVLSAPSSGWHLKESAPGYRIYEHDTPTPRAWLAEEVLVLDPADEVAAYRLGRRPDGSRLDPLETVILDHPLTLGGPARSDIRQQYVRVLDSGGNRMILEVETPRPAVLVVANAWDDGWRANLNDQDVPILKANGGISAVAVPAGRHRVVMTYRPMPVFVGGAITGLALLGIGLLVAMAIRRSGASGPLVLAAGIAPIAAFVTLAALPMSRTPETWAPTPLQGSLMYAVLTNNSSEIRLLPDGSRTAVESFELTGWLAPLAGEKVVLTPLNAAIINGNNTAIEFLLGQGVPVGEIDLCLARVIDYSELERMLIERMAPGSGLPKLCKAPASLERAVWLARHGLADFRKLAPGEVDPEDILTLVPGTAVMHLAVGNGRLIEAHLSNGWDPNTEETVRIDSTGESVTIDPVLVPVLLDDVSFVAMMLEGGVDLSRPGTALAMCEARRRNLTGVQSAFERHLQGREWPNCSRQAAPWTDPLRETLARFRQEYH